MATLIKQVVANTKRETLIVQLKNGTHRGMRQMGHAVSVIFGSERVRHISAEKPPQHDHEFENLRSRFMQIPPKF